MKNFLFRALLTGLLVVAGDSAFAQVIDHDATIKNTFGSAANDLHLTFTVPVGNVKFQKADGTAVTPSSSTATTADWSMAQLGESVANTAGRHILYNGDAAGLIDKTPAKSWWTSNDVKLDNSLARIGGTPAITFDATGAVATFFNPEAFSVTYSNIQLFKDNNLANFNGGFAEFDMPTGTLVTGLPSSITLDPGQSRALAFGAIGAQGYELALANAAATSIPTDLYLVGTATILPEPSILTLAGTGALGVLGCWWWRRRRQTAT